MSSDALSIECAEYDLQYSPPPPTPASLSPAERRTRARSILRVQARVLVDGEAVEVDTVDLSPHGVAVTSTRPLNIDQECSVELGISVASLATPPQLRASVRYCARMGEDRFRIGMKFTAVSIEAAELIVDALEL
jgi:hypothetical protein